MNDLEYLNKISAANRPAMPDSGFKAFLKSKWFKIIAGGIAAIIFVMILGSMISSIGAKERNLLIKMNTRMTNISRAIDMYNPKVKSSALRGMGASLSGILSETNRDVYAYLLGDYDFTVETVVDEEIVNEEAGHAAALDSTLENAKLSGILDRIYVAQLNYEIALLMSMESETVARTGNEGLKATLEKSMESLTKLSEQLSNYSDATN